MKWMNIRGMDRGTVALSLSTWALALTTAGLIILSMAAPWAGPRTAGLALLGGFLVVVLGIASMIRAVMTWRRVHGPSGSTAARAGAMLGLLTGFVPFLLLTILLPQFIKARTRPSQNSCINNLRQIDSAKAQWALEHNKKDTDEVMISDLAPYLKGGALPDCPSAGGTYKVTTVSSPPTCSISSHTL